MRIVVINHVTLDGVMQSPGRPDEDTRDGFARGGWAAAPPDEAVGAALGRRMSGDHAFLFGHRTYDDLMASWNRQGGPFQAALNDATKYVASTHLATALDWPNSKLLSGDVPAAVADLRAQDGGNLVVMGSGQLIGSLLPHGLIDEFFLMIHPLVLGRGRRLFGPDGADLALRLTDSETTPGGLLLASFVPA